MMDEAAADGIDVGHVGHTVGPRCCSPTSTERRDAACSRTSPSRRCPPSRTSAAPRRPSADTVSIQLQEPADAVLSAARRGTRAGARVIADGVVEPDAVDELLESVDVLRADAKEAELLAGEPVRSVSHALQLATRLLKAGPKLVALAVSDRGDLLVWRGGSHLYPPSKTPTIDPTGAGDAFMAGLVAALRDGASSRRCRRSGQQSGRRHRNAPRWAA